MAKGIINLGTDSRGNYRKDIGWEPKSSGDGFKQHTFYFGTNQTQGQIRCLKTIACWDAVQARWNRRPADSRGSRPLWSKLTTAIALAVAGGQEDFYLDEDAYQVEEKMSSSVQPPSVEWFQQIQKDFNMIRLHLPEEQAAMTGNATRALKTKAETYARLAGDVVVCAGQTLHEAIDAFIASLKEEYKTPEGQVTQCANVWTKQLAIIKREAPNTALAAFGLDEIKNLVNHWNNRPKSKSTGKPVTKETVKHFIKRINAFIKWLHRSSAFAWRKPEDYEPAKVKFRETQAERAKKLSTTQVETYTVEELVILWRYASPRVRLYMALAMNCGFGQAEIASLQEEEVHLNRVHWHYKGLVGSFVRRLRGKTDIYGEWKLWPITVQALSWWKEHRPVTTETALITTARGVSLQKPTKGNNRNTRIANAWSSLTKRIRLDIPEFPRKSFNKLRKTSGNIMRERAGGEMLAIFHSRGKTVASDDQAEVYTNRPFNKMYGHLDKIGEELSPVFGSVADPFPADGRKRSPSISLVVREKIVSMRREGASYDDIGKACGVTKDTVARYLRQAGLVKAYKTKEA